LCPGGTFLGRKRKKEGGFLSIRVPSASGRRAAPLFRRSLGKELYF
jgi:hypothetical protein